MDQEDSVIFNATKQVPSEAKGVWWIAADMGKLLGQPVNGGAQARFNDHPANWTKGALFKTGMILHTHQAHSFGGPKT